MEVDVEVREVRVSRVKTHSCPPLALLPPPMHDDMEVNFRPGVRAQEGCLEKWEESVVATSKGTTTSVSVSVSTSLRTLARLR